MASIPQFYSDCSFPSTDFSQFSYPAGAAVGENNNCRDGTVSNGKISSGCGAVSSGDAIWNTEENFPISFNNIMPPESDVVPPVPMASFPEQLGLYDSAVPTLPPEYTNTGLYGISGVQNFGARFQIPTDACEFGDDCYGFMHEFKPAVYPVASENWGLQNNQIKPAMEDSNIIKVGRYSVEERKDRILRYLKKKNQRNFNKTIKYACRKTLADRRVRVHGRFARNNELSEEEMVMNSSENCQKEELYSTVDSIQIKQDEEWLRDAMASLMYLPYIAG